MDAVAISNMQLGMVQQSASLAVLGKAMDTGTQNATMLIQDMTAAQPAAFVRPGGMDIRV